MRLIDADLLIQTLNNKEIPYSADINEAILNAPTVERKKGKWIEIKHTYFYKCSECDWTNDVGCSYDFCPNCGADMRENKK